MNITDILFGSPGMSSMMSAMGNSPFARSNSGIASDSSMSTDPWAASRAMAGTGGGAGPSTNGGMDWNDMLMRMMGMGSMGGMGGMGGMGDMGGSMGGGGPLSRTPAMGGGQAPLLQALQSAMSNIRGQSPMAGPINTLMRRYR